MHINEKEKRLEEIFRKNNNKGFAVAITGCWGVGKTYFWDNFLNSQLSEERIYKKDNVFNRKYAYVSLFGVESLSDLKTQIYSNIENNHSSIEVPKWLKGLPSIFKDTRVSGLGISAPVKLIDNLMFNQVKDSIICFDDFERMSNKLDIKDVMGLANQLKLERNCQVILILDESKTEESNKNKYAEYKEKLIDETIKIVSVEPLIRDKSKGIDAPLVDLMVKFAEELDIHNFRFFQKIINLYSQFRRELPDEVADSSKKVILIRILQGYFIEDFGQKREIDWNDFKLPTQVNTLLRKKYDKDSIKKENIQLKKIMKISTIFSRNDLWGIEFKKWFEQKDFSYDSIKKIADSDLINEKNNEIKKNFWKLEAELWNYQANENFVDLYFNASMHNVGLLDLGNLSRAVNTLEQLGAGEYSLELDSKIKDWIKEKLSLDLNAFNTMNDHINGKHLYVEFIEQILKEYEQLHEPLVADAIYEYFIEKNIVKKYEQLLELMTQDELKKFIESDFISDTRFHVVTLDALVNRFSPELKLMVKEILNERKTESKFQNNYVNLLISNINS